MPRSSEWDAWVAEARSANIIDVASKHPALNKLTSTRKGTELSGACPKCGGDDRFVVTNTERKKIFRCRGCNPKGGDVIDMVMFVDICTFERAVEIITGKEPPKPQSKPKKAKAALGKIVAGYPYTDENAELLFQVVRYEPKDFRQRRPNKSTQRGWIWDLDGVRLVPYRLRQVLAAVAAGQIVLVVEGEKDVASAEALDHVATCAPGGIGMGWRDQYDAHFVGADVCIVPDNDADPNKGLRYARDIADHLVKVAKRVRMLTLPEGIKDLSELAGREGGLTRADLDEMIAATPDYVPPDDKPQDEPKPEAPKASQPGKSGGGDDDGGKRPKQADILIELAGRAEELFHTPDGTAFATIPVDDHFETWPVRGRGFKKWLAREFYNETSSAPNSDATQAALNVLEARAAFDGAERDVFLRVGAYKDKLYLDLVDKLWRVVEIDKDGWRIVDRAPIPFRRSAGMRALPVPVKGGSIDELRPFLNIASKNKNDDSDNNKDRDDSFVLVVSFILAALRERGPYPVLGLAGEHGSAKSTLTAILRKLIDPNSAPLRALPREDRDLFIAANNGHLLAFDNVSNLPDWISDTLCRLATGGGFATRSLYSDMDETLFDATRPVILNGIEDIVIRPDLADRSIFLSLESIADDKRKAEKQFWADFDAAHPRILGALLDGVATGLRQLPTVKLDKIPRMADFALWSTACETAYWDAGTFMRAYGQNRDDAVAVVIEADTVATAVQSFVIERPDLKQQKQGSLLNVDRTKWEGTSTGLLDALKMAVGKEKVEQMVKRKEWPGNPRALSARLRRAAGTLRKVGIETEFVRDPTGKKRTRTIILTYAVPSDPENLRPDRPVRPEGRKFNSLMPDEAPDVSGGGEDVSVRRPSGDNPLKNKASDAPDTTDASFPTLSDGPDNEGETCAFCGLAAFGGGQMWPGPNGTGTIYLHRRCEGPYADSQMREQGVD